MSDIYEEKKYEMLEIEDFCDVVREYGHVFRFDLKDLDDPFRKILEGISEIKKMMDDSYGM